MTKHDDRINVQSDARDTPTGGDTIIARRKRLAQLIGRLLARTWLRERRAIETTDHSPSGRQDCDRL